jgi:hypothetical protein
MAQLGELLSRLVGPSGTRGLSGDADRVLPPEARFAFYNDRLRRHRTTDDFVAEPERLWRTSGFLSRRGGLEAHLLANIGDGLARWSDILVIVNAADWGRSLGRLDQPWTEQVAAHLRARFERFSVENNMHRLFPQRPMGVRAVMDGGAELRGGRLGLEPGEFVTGLLTNFYGGVTAATRPVVAVHVHIPGAWEGYREVGRLYSDQVLFTLGNHWLDNFQHPRLEMPALYRLQQLSEGGFVHLVSPDIDDAVRVVRERGDGPAVLTLQRKGGEALAHLVLAEVDPIRDPIFMEDTQSLGGAHVPLMASPTLVGPVRAPQMSGGLHSRTVVPVEVEERLLTLHERGVLLQKVHFSRFMQGYDVYLGRDGEIGTAMRDPAATVAVRGAEVLLRIHHGDVRLDGDPVPPGAAIHMHGDHRIAVGSHTLAWRDLSAEKADGWPYLAELRRPGATLHLVFGARHKIGREPRCAVRLPDEPHNANLAWRSDLPAGDTIRSRNGDIPKSRFYLDSIMVASQHAEIDLSREPVLFGLARDCYTYVRRRGALLPLLPTRATPGEATPPNIDLQPEDELLIGNCVFELSYPPSSGLSQDLELDGDCAPPLTAALLAAAMDELDPEELDAYLPLALPKLGRAPAAEDAPTARGLGERGPAPARLRLPEAAPEAPPRVGPSPLMLLDDTQLDARSAPLSSTGRNSPADDFADDGAMDGILEQTIGRSTDEADLPTGQPPPIRAVLSDQLAGEDSLLHPSAAMADPSALPEPPPPPAAAELPRDAHALPAPAPTPGGVVVVDEREWQLELARPARLRVVGWMVSREVLVGNHEGADVILPENRAEPQQVFSPVDYFRLRARGRSGRAQLLSHGEAALYDGAERVDQTTRVEEARFEVLRRDPFGQEDFRVVMRLVEDPGLPDPRALLLSVDDRDRMVGALLTFGLPLRTPRALRIAGVSFTAAWDGEGLRMSGYLHDYALPDGRFKPLFVRQGGRPFRTLPEDGAPVRLLPGDRLLLGATVVALVADPGPTA